MSQTCSIIFIQHRVILLEATEDQDLVYNNVKALKPTRSEIDQIVLRRSQDINKIL